MTKESQMSSEQMRAQMLELADAGTRHGTRLTAQLDKPDWRPSRAHIEQARNSIVKLAAQLRLAAQSAAPVGEPRPSLETRVRAETRIPLIKIAAACHRSKWQFSADEENRLPAAEARRLVQKAFYALHDIGDMANKAAEELWSAAPPPGTPQVREWQPIETNPFVSAKRFMITEGDRLAIPFVGFRIYETGPWFHDGFGEVYPTHWMELPDTSALAKPGDS